jgi:hypothetical protein
MEQYKGHKSREAVRRVRKCMHILYHNHHPPLRSSVADIVIFSSSWTVSSFFLGVVMRALRREIQGPSDPVEGVLGKRRVERIPA